jgi:hypothetical protein
MSRSLEVLFEFFNIFCQFSGTQLPVESEVIEHALLCFSSLWDLSWVGSSIAVGPTTGSKRRLFNLFTTNAVKNGSGISRVKVGTFSMNPSFAMVTHNPLFSIIRTVEVDLLAI